MHAHESKQLGVINSSNLLLSLGPKSMSVLLIVGPNCTL